MTTQTDIASRLDFLIADVARLNGRRFDRLSRQRIGLSRAQCRLLGVLSMRKAEGPVKQVTLADDLDMTPMGVAKLCERMEAAGWILRQADQADRRANLVTLGPRAPAALSQALQIADALQADALEGLSARDIAQLGRLMQRVHANVAAKVRSRPRALPALTRAPAPPP